jgi:hypothetical protein
MQFVIKSVSAGEPTEILASLTRQEVVGIDKLGTALSQTLLLSGKEIDVTPADSGTTKSKKPGSVMHEVTYAQFARSAATSLDDWSR